MQNEEACGALPVVTLMHLAQQKGWKTKLLDYRNSGDTSGDRSGVVGYAAIAFYESVEPDESAETAERELTEKEQEYLIDLARKTLVEGVTNKKLAKVEESDVPERLRQRGACFVTLNKDDELRGCIGHIFACRPLYQSVMENAVQAALADRRFPPVEAKELDDIEIEISILTSPKCIEFDSPKDLLTKLRPGTDGVVFGMRGKRATYLPQVWEQIPKKEEFLSQLAKKAKLEPTAWKDPDAAFLTYQVQAFHEDNDE
jgi:AmmeMemoRadiSam system protein A